jgi:hypothetical protein
MAPEGDILVHHILMSARGSPWDSQSDFLEMRALIMLAPYYSSIMKVHDYATFSYLSRCLADHLETSRHIHETH